MILSYFIWLLHDPFLYSFNMISEMIVYKVVCEYVRVNKEKLKQEEINELFETVRFPFLTFGKNLSSHYRSFLISNGIVDIPN